MKEFSKEIIALEEYFFSTLHKMMQQRRTAGSRDAGKETIRRLAEVDGYSMQQITDVIEVFRKDRFWSQNFVTLSKLRRINANSGWTYMQLFSDMLERGSVLLQEGKK